MTSTYEQDISIKNLTKEIKLLRLSIGELRTRIEKTEFNKIKNIQDYEFQVYSQWGDDGIIQFLIHYLEINDKRFVEFGVENYRECNTRSFYWLGEMIIGRVLLWTDQMRM